MSYSLIQTCYAPIPKPTLQKAYIDILSLTVIDASTRANRNNKGFFISELSDFEAKKLQNYLFDKANIHTEIIESPPRFHSSFNVKISRSAPEESGFVVYDFKGSKETIPWQDISMVSLSKLPKNKNALSAFDIYLTVASRDRRQFISNEKQFNYAYLAEKLSAQYKENFHNLLSDIVNYAPKSSLEGTIKHFFEKGENSIPKFTKAEDLLPFNDWFNLINTHSPQSAEEGRLYLRFDMLSDEEVNFQKNVLKAPEKASGSLLIPQKNDKLASADVLNNKQKLKLTVPSFFTLGQTLAES